MSPARLEVRMELAMPNAANPRLLRGCSRNRNYDPRLLAHRSTADGRPLRIYTLMVSFNPSPQLVDSSQSRKLAL